MISEWDAGRGARVNPRNLHEVQTPFLRPKTGPTSIPNSNRKLLHFMARGRGKWGGKAATRDGKVRRAASRDLPDLRISGISIPDECPP